MSTMASQLTSLTTDCLLNRLFGRRSKKTSKLRVTGLCEGNSLVTGEFHAQRASNAENVFIWWRHHDMLTGSLCLLCYDYIFYNDGVSKRASNTDMFPIDDVITNANFVPISFMFASPVLEHSYCPCVREVILTNMDYIGQ